MYKVVIVDDEPIIVKGLVNMVDWQAHGCQVVGTAGSGTAGMKVINEQKPDILFSDIRMSDMDGLTMIAALKSEHANMEITILTGYRDFSYAQEAIRLGVRRFLLKPSKMDEINEAVDAMTKELASRSSAAAEEEEPTPAAGFLVRKALAYMEEHYNEHIQLNDVADHVYVSQWHLSKLINSEMNKNFSELLNGIRIRHAKELLKDSSYRIQDVADQVGFQDLPHFSRVFKKTTGMTPNEYRNSLRG
ncbi:MAG: response regulator [Bulleidia sp.]|nr:response regulator [Bulleidia sp.]